ncbi:DarT ssDNA thymidine ADP-ribosyltransferase family protein [Saccharicrinis sp. GN24d3]|uniref:DarT ssDNA thymidine ADP-ribosyltransferase family protein n=1 Tax=Saccharicrinis sp. GN24d3 TaxID=3458416 RepID=UPI0040375799
MNWQDIINKAELVYASVNGDKGFRTWSLKKTKCKVSFYKEYAIEDIDKLVCSILQSNDNKIDEEKFATLLGFNVIDNFEVSPKRYADKAELDVFNTIIKAVIDWGLAKKVDKSYYLTELGQRALIEEKKYKFFSGTKELFENPNLYPHDEDDNLFFPFYSALGISSEIEAVKEIDYSKIKVEEVFNTDETDLTIRIKLQSSKELCVFFSELTPIFSFGSSQVDIKLFQKGGEYYPIIFHKDKVSVQATELLHKPDNLTQKEKKVEWGLYLKLMKDKDARLDYETIIPFADLLELSNLIIDSRLIWSDNSLFDFIADNADADQWYSISNNCPIEVLKKHINKYKDNLDWTSLSLRIDDAFLIENAVRYPWNYEAISSKDEISIEVLKTLLLIPDLKEQDWDWDVIMPQLDFDFIKANIDKIDFELSELTKNKIDEVQPLICQYPMKNWDWSYISKEYDLSYILENINTFSSYINLEVSINRAFSSRENVLDFCKSTKFQEALFNAKDATLAHYSANSSNYIWSEALIDLLENTGYITWESSKYVAGFECNPFIDWSYNLFNKYQSKFVTQKGIDFISSQITSTKIVSDFVDFNWNWELISKNPNLVNSSDFIIELKDKISIECLLSSINGETFEKIFSELNILGFLEDNPNKWSDVTEKPSREFILQHINWKWDWNVLTKRFCANIKIEALGNEKWVDKWDWHYLTQNLDFNIVTENLDLYVDRWDWHYLTKNISKEFLLNNLPEYNNYWKWELLLTERIEKEDLELQRLIEVATCISDFNDELNTKLWEIITRKFNFSELDKLITNNIELFNWDYSYFYDLPEFNPLNYLNERVDFIDWTAFSGSKSLNKTLKRDESLFSYGAWIKWVIDLINSHVNSWDFKSLSKLDNINWNSSILKIRTSKWDWEYLSEHSRCFKKEKDFKIFKERFDAFIRYIDFQVFSQRTDSGITEELINETIDRNWDWQAISVNQSIKLSIEFVKEHSQKEWNWHYLSSRKDIKINDDILIQLSGKDWDWAEISTRTDIGFSEEVIIKIYDKPLDWFLVSQNETFTPSATVLSLLSSKELDWISISKNPKISTEILWNYKELLDWVSITKNDAIKLSDISFLSKYADYLDWDYISLCEDFKASKENLFQFKSKLNWISICSRKDFEISEDLLEPLADVLDWSIVSQSMRINFTETLIEEYKNKWDWQALRQNPKVIERLHSSLNKYKSEFNCADFIEQFSREPFIYHFTHLFNAIDIIKKRKILSRNKANGNFANAAGNLVERRDTAHHFARFYFRPQTPTQFYNECLGKDQSDEYYTRALKLGLPKCPMPVFFKFDLKEVLLKMPSKCFYSTGNMQTNRARVEKVTENPKSINTDYLYSSISDGINLYKEYSQQEFLVDEEFDFSQLNSFEIICYNSEYANILKSQLGDDPIISKINEGSGGIYHRGNRELLIFENDSEIRIESEYRSNAYLLIKGDGIKELEITDTENIKKATATEIFAYPKIQFIKTEKPIEVYFVDTTIEKRDWLIYKN